MRPGIVLASLFAAGCASDGVPMWAMDTVYVDEVDAGVYGFHTWELFADGWDKNHKKKYYVCSVIVELEGTPSSDEACTGCSEQWAIAPSFLESDCGEPWASEESFLSLTALARGAVPAEIAADDPYPGQSQGGFVRYGDGAWETHGWSYQASLDEEGGSGDGILFWPAWAWDLSGNL